MLPINPRDLQRQLKQLRRLGIKMEPLEGVERVVIELPDKDLVIENAQVMALTMGGQKVFYVYAPTIREVPHTRIEEAEQPTPSVVTVSEDDIKFVMEYTGVEYERAKRALELAGGDIAKAIDLIQSGKA